MYVGSHVTYKVSVTNLWRFPQSFAGVNRKDKVGGAGGQARNREMHNSPFEYGTTIRLGNCLIDTPRTKYKPILLMFSLKT